MNIALLIIATGNYHIFVNQFLESVERFFFKGFHVKIYLFTDKFDIYKTERINIDYINVPTLQFPYPTLYRYKWFSGINIKEDYIFYCDIDMKFVVHINSEILSELIVVKHPGFYMGGGSFETNPRSRAYTPNGEIYVAGGFNGGRNKKYISMIKELAKSIDEDERNSIMAIWHDESHLNRYINEKFQEGQELNILNPGYCYPENWNLPFKKKLLALQKNHNKIRAI